MIRLLSLLMILAAPLVAQDAAPSMLQAKESPWEVTCQPVGDGGQVACAMSKSLIQTEGNRLIAQATIVPESDGLVLRLLAPHGLQLKEGLKLAIDGQALPAVPFTTSLPGGVVARMTLTSDVITLLKAGEVLSVMATQVSGSTFSFDLTLTGFAASLDKLK